MFGEDCILGEGYGGRRQLSKKGSHNMQKTFAVASVCKLVRGYSYCSQFKDKVGAIRVADFLEVSNPDPHSFSRSEDLRPSLGMYILNIARFPQPAQSLQRCGQPNLPHQVTIDMNTGDS